MKTKILILCCAVSLASIAQKQDSLIIKFRSVPISRGRVISLQADITNLLDLIKISRPGHYYLKPGTFGGADSIDIETNAKNKIIAVAFYYAPGHKYKKGINTFNRLLGAGMNYEYSTKQLEMKVTQWQDRLTTFEFVEKNKGCYSIMFDRELFGETYKAGQDQHIYKSPFELLRVQNVFSMLSSVTVNRK